MKIDVYWKLPDCVLVELYKLWSKEMCDRDWVKVTTDTIPLFRDWLKALSQADLEDYEADMITEFREQEGRLGGR